MVHGASFAPTRTRATSASLGRSIASALGAEASDGGERAGDAIDGPAGSEPVVATSRGSLESARDARHVSTCRAASCFGMERAHTGHSAKRLSVSVRRRCPGDTPIAVDCRRFIVARGGGARGARRVARMRPLMRTGPSVRSEFSARRSRTAAPEISRARAEDGRFRSFPRHSTRARGRRACRTARAKPTRPPARRHRDER